MWPFRRKDKFDRIYSAIDREEPEECAARLGIEWNLADIHVWNKRYERCESCGMWNPKGWWVTCDSIKCIQDRVV